MCVCTNECVSVCVCVERLAVSLAQRLVSRRLRSHLPTSVTVAASEAFDCTVTLNSFSLSACAHLTV